MPAAPRQPLGESTNREATRGGTKACLPPEFLSIGVPAAEEEGVSAAAASPDTATTFLKLHAKSVANAVDGVNIALTEILWERTVYPRDIFRTVSKFGLVTHRLGSIHSSADESLSAQLAEALSQVSRAEELVATRPAALCVEFVDAASEAVERWQLELDIDQAERAATSEELHAEIGIALKQVQRSSVFLPPLEAEHSVRIAAQAAAPVRSEATVPPDEDEDDEEEDYAVRADGKRAPKQPEVQPASESEASLTSDGMATTALLGGVAVAVVLAAIAVFALRRAKR